ncbi:MAG: WbqC family protein, partial [Bacteroidia bacterium]
MDVLLSTAYWPNLHYFYYVLNADKVRIEKQEHYQKQSFRNRMQLLSANGILDLSIPVKKNNDNGLIPGIEISYKEPWQIKHWRAITSAYNNSPYFEYFEDDLKGFYEHEYQYLFDYNMQQLKTILRILKTKKEI